MLLSKPVYGRLEDGVYDVNLVDFQEKQGKDGKDNYLELQLKFEDGRETKDTWFTSNIDVKANQLFAQLDTDESLTLGELLEQAKAKESIRVWVSHAQANNRTYRNINYQERYTVQSDDEEVDDNF